MRYALPPRRFLGLIFASHITARYHFGVRFASRVTQPKNKFSIIDLKICTWKLDGEPKEVFGVTIVILGDLLDRSRVDERLVGDHLPTCNASPCSGI